MQRNRWTSYCVRCPKGSNVIPPQAGFVHHLPGEEPYAVCARHALTERVPEPDFLEQVLAAFPRPDPLNPTATIAPYPYQAQDARRIANVRALLVGNQQGTGKTPTTAIGGLRPDMGNVIFAPTSVKWNWEREVKRWRPDLSVSVVSSKAHWKLPEPGHVLIASWGLIPGEPCQACRAAKQRACAHQDDQSNPLPTIDRPIVLVADEVQYLQNKTARRRRWDLLAERVWAAGGRLYGLTGTVIGNKPDDLWEILSALYLERAAFPLGYTDEYVPLFSEWYLNKKGRRHAPVGDRRRELLETLRPVRICRLRKHVLKHLPPVIEKEIRVELSKQTIAEVNEAVQKLLAVRRAWQDAQEGIVPNPWGKDRVQGKWQALSPDEKARRQGLWEDRVRFYYETRPWVTDEELRLAVAGALESKGETPALHELAKIRAMLALAKITVALELVEKHEREEEPLLVFCQHIGVLQKLLDGRAGWGLYTGKVAQKARDQLVQAFQAGEIQHGLGLSITAGGEGINLTRAGSMLFIDEHWSPGKNDQAAARVQRPGAERHDVLYLIRLIADHAVDRLLQVTLREKGELQRALEDDQASVSGMGALAGSAA